MRVRPSNTVYEVSGKGKTLLGCCKNRKLLFMTEYHFLALSSKTVYQFLQLRFMSCYLLNGSMTLTDSGSFFCLPHSEFLGTSVSVQSGSWSRWITSLSSAAGAPRRITRPGICTIRYPPLQEGTHGASFSPALCCQVGMQLFFTAKHMDFFCIPWRMYMNTHGARHLWASSGDYLLFFENNPLHQLGLFGLNA